MAQPTPHHSNCTQNRRRFSGLSEDGTEFQQMYNIDIPFRLNCLGCCFAYLIERDYTETPNLSFDRVCYSSHDLAVPGTRTGDLVSSFVKVPGGPRGRKGQIATHPDPNLGNMMVRPFQESRTYQLYSEAYGVLSVGFVARARMESVAIENVKPEELVEIYFNYADAALVELYRKHQGLDSLSRPEVTGYLLLHNPQEVQAEENANPST